MMAERAARKVILLLSGLALLAAMHAQVSYTTPYKFTTLAGVAGTGSIDGTGAAARFDRPNTVAVNNTTGDIYVADSNNNTIRKITAGGVVTTFAGAAGVEGSADGTGGAARFRYPFGLAVDHDGNVYVADNGNSTIRKITPAGVVTTLAGTAGSNDSVDGTGNAARFFAPEGVAVDSAGNVYVGDTQNQTIRVITPGGVVTTLAGMPGFSNAGSLDGTGSAARFNYPAGLAVDGSGNVYVADNLNDTIRKITAAGVVTTIAGTAGTRGSADGTGSDVRFNSPTGVALDGSGNVYVVDTGNSTIRKITSAGAVSTIAGLAGKNDSTDGLGTAANFSYPGGLALDGLGNIYVADSSNNTIRKITTDGMVSTVAGLSGGSNDGTGGGARFYQPSGVAVDTSGNSYVADTANNTIRKITAAGVVTMFAGTVGSVGSLDGTGSAAQFNLPVAVAVDNAGNVYVADYGNSTIRKITAAGVVTTLAGLAGNYGSADGTGGEARFFWPRGVAVDAAGNVYVADYFNSTIRKITAAGVVTTLAGSAGNRGSTDGTGNNARFDWPRGVAVDGAGNVYVADFNNYTIRKITTAGVVSTFAGVAGLYGAVDGTGSAARFSDMQGLAVDGLGNVYVADSGNNLIRRITPAAVVTTLAGAPGNTGAVDGTGSAARFRSPVAVAVGGTRTLYVADSENDTILKGMPDAGAPVTDLNGDGISDVVWSDTTTGERAIWLMSGGTLSAGASLGTIPTAWTISGTGDFDGDGKADILLTNMATGDRAMWLMNGTKIATNLYVSNVPVEWVVSAVGDFDGDGKADIFWTNTATGDRAVWLMNGNVLSSAAYLGNVPVEWKVSGTGDFNGDGKADIVWTNTATGDRSMWLMNGLTLSGGGSLGNIPVAWTISGVGDFDGDGKADILLSNTATGDRAMWLMNGTTISTNLYVGNLPVEWTVSAVGDFNGDGKTDIFWSDTSTGDRATWLMNGNALSAGFYLGAVPVEWGMTP